MHQAGVRVKPADLRPSLPIEAQEVILKALSYNPVDRFSSPRDFGDHLARALAQEVEHTGSPSKPSAELPPTQLSNEETPLAKSPAAAAKTIQVPFQPAQPVSASSGPGFGGESRRSKSKLIPLLAIAALLIAVASVAIWYVTRSRTDKTEGKGPDTPAAAERNLSYGLTVQKMRSDRPYQEPFESSGQEIFENGWKFRMNVTSPQEGYLYLLNEGPAAGDQTTYNVLFPEPKTNGGSPHVTADQKLQTAWMRFDDNQGTEKFWIVWAAAPVKELDAVTDAVNDQDQGEIKDSAERRSVRDFLAQHSSPKPEVAKDSAKKQTTLKGKGNTLVSFIELEHH
jgi:hypothetical protein